MSEKILAAYEIEDDETCELLGITRAETRVVRVGRRPVRVYEFEADPELVEFLKRDLRRKYCKEDRASRCYVPGTRRGSVVCPETNHCACCPYGRSRDNALPREVSLDAMLEQEAPASLADPEERLTVSEEVAELEERIRREDPMALRVVRLRAEGYDVNEIARLLDLSPYAVRQAMERVREIGRRYRAGEASGSGFLIPVVVVIREEDMYHTLVNPAPGAAFDLTSEYRCETSSIYRARAVSKLIRLRYGAGE